MALALVYMVFVIVFKDRNNYTKCKCRFNIYWSLSNPLLRGGGQESAEAGVCYACKNTPLRPSQEGIRTTLLTCGDYLRVITCSTNPQTLPAPETTAAFRLCHGLPRSSMEWLLR
jgi:hypothetical protein